MRRSTMIAAMGTVVVILGLGTMVQADVDWIEYVAEDYAIKFPVPRGMEISEKENGKWGMMTGTFHDGDVKLVVQGTKERKSLDEIEEYGLKDLGVRQRDYTMVDEGTRDGLTYRTYIFNGMSHGVETSLAVFVAQHETKAISYIGYIRAEIGTVKQYAPNFYQWYKNVRGI